MKLIEEARQAIGEAPDTSVEHLSQQLGVSVGTCHTIVRKDEINKNPVVLENVTNAIRRRTRLCLQEQGAHFQHLL
ncbi:unnamed protein product [Tenebrio molitor]|nr:unnamed protein product [Tenebrio molitor]